MRDKHRIRSFKKWDATLSIIDEWLMDILSWASVLASIIVSPFIWVSDLPPSIVFLWTAMCIFAFGVLLKKKVLPKRRTPREDIKEPFDASNNSFNGRIYYLVNDKNRIFYVGMTCRPLENRYNEHRYRKFRDIYPFEILLIEDEISTEKEMRRREKYWISEFDRDYNLLNKIKK